MLSRHNGPDEHKPEILLTGITEDTVTRNMWDIAIGDVFPQSAALEILGVDQSGTVYLVHKAGDGWQGEIVWPGTGEPLFAVVSGDFAPGRSGDEIMVAGQAGTLTLLTPSAVPACADLDGDGNVGPADLAMLLGAWGPNPNHPADFDGDGIVNAFDLAVMLGAWGPCE